MNTPATPAARSLKRKFLQPLMLAGAALSLAGVWSIYGVSRCLVLDRMRLRAELLASSVSYAAESVPHQGELQRIVSALGAETDVDVIVVAGGHPARVLAATRSAWVGHPLDTLPAKEIAEGLHDAVRVRKSSGHYDAEISRFEFSSPLMLSRPEVAPGSLSDGAMVIHLDSTSNRNAIRQLTVRVSTAFVLVLAGMTVLGYRLVNRLVLNPVSKIATLIERRQEGASTDLSEAETDDEIGALTRALGSSLARTDSALRELRDQKFALDQHAIVAITDARGKITYLNDNFCVVSKYPRAELLGQHYGVLNPGLHAREFIWNIRDTVTGGKVWKGELASSARDGSVNWGDTTIVPFLGDDGKPFQYVAIRTDITEHKRVEERLRLQSSALESVANAIVITDLDGKVEWVNPAFTKLSGYATEEAVGRNPRELLNSGHHDGAFFETMWATILAGDIWEGEIVNRRKDRTTYTEHQTITPVRDADGTIEHFVAIKEDVTQRQHLEEQLRQAQKMEAIGRLAGGIAHDFNNQLFVIAGYCDLLADAAAEQTSLLNPIAEIRNAARRSAALTAQLLAFGRKQVLMPRVLDLNAELLGIKKTLRSLVTEDVRLTIATKEGVGSVRVDPTQLHQIVMNLVLNAIDAMPAGGGLTLETGDAELDESYAQSQVDLKPGRYVWFSIADTGQGMDASTLANVFEPFFTTKKAGKGTGLGLATVHGIVKQSGGHVSVASRPGHGTRFTIFFPRVDDPLDSVDNNSAAAAVEGTETILLAEDEPAVRDVVRRLLEAHGYHVLEAGDGEQALEAARSFDRHIDLLLTDVVMPGMSGPQLAERLATLRPGTRVLYMSGYADEAVIRHGLSGSGHAFVPKPCPADLLLHKLREVLDVPEVADAAPRHAKRTGRILVVDDSRDELTLEARLLSKAGYEVVEAASGEEALAVLEKETVDAVLTDVNMPGLDGFGLTEAIRCSPRWRHLPVVILTGACTPEEQQRSRSAGATACLDKGATDQQRLLAILADL